MQEQLRQEKRSFKIDPNAGFYSSNFNSNGNVQLRSKSTMRSGSTVAPNLASIEGGENNNNYLNTEGTPGPQSYQ